jgi:hypothetical protein
MTKTVTKMSVKSDVISRISKIRAGVVYKDIKTFIEELIQNTQRASATSVRIYIYDNVFIIEDNGEGCSDPNVLFTIDHTGFKVGFGEGFTSVYTIADYVKVESLDWTANLDIDNQLKKRDLADLSFNLESNDVHKNGFKVTLHGSKIEKYSSELISKVKEVCELIPGITFYFMDEIIPKKDIFKINNEYEYEYKQRFSNRMYEGVLMLCPPHMNDGYIKIYNDYRYVTEIYHYGVSGVIHLKPNAVTLRSPDRKDIIHDDKRRKLTKVITKDISYLLKLVLNEGNPEKINDYSETIEYYLDVTDYIKFLTISESAILNQRELKVKEHVPVNNYDDTDEEDNENNDYPVSDNPNQFQQQFLNTSSAEVAASLQSVGQSLQSLSELQQIESFPIVQNIVTEEMDGTEEEREVDTKRKEDDQHFVSYISSNHVVTKKSIAQVSIRNIKSKKNVVWVEKNNADLKQSLISKYEYYKIFTFVSPHVLYDKALKFLGIPHIDSVEYDAISKDYSVTRIGSLNKKEERVMEILSYIEHKMNLPRTFYISDIKCTMTVSLHNAKLHKEQLPVEGYAKGQEIHLNRKSLGFGKINSILLGRESLSIHDLKFLLSNLELIAHELAHVVYGTEDNTIAHLEAQNQIQKQIADIIMNCETL